MSPSSVKNSKSELKKIKLVAQKPRKITAAIKAWATAAEKTDCDPLKLAGAPAWAEQALIEGVKVILPGKRLPTAGECDAEFIGELIGRQRAFAKLFAGEIPMSQEMQSDLEQITKQAAALPQTPERLAIDKRVAKDFLNMVNANDQAIPQLMTAVMASSHEDSLKFQNGLMRGMNLVADELDAGIIKQRYTDIYFELGLHWRNYHQCRSVGEVYRKLGAKLGEERVGSQKHFENRIAKVIGMKFRRSGRPSKRK